MVQFAIRKAEALIVFGHTKDHGYFLTTFNTPQDVEGKLDINPSEVGTMRSNVYTGKVGSGKRISYAEMEKLWRWHWVGEEGMKLIAEKR